MDNPDDPEFPDPATFYDSSPYTGPWTAAEEKAQAVYLGSGDRYYRYLANKCCPFIYYERMREVPGALDRIGQANRDYDAVVRYMERRILLPALRQAQGAVSLSNREERGVQWNYRGRPRVLFAFQDFEHALPALRAATDVTAGRRLSGLHGALRAQKGHTYLLEVGAAWWPF
jgi:hypothetical protein